MSIHFTRVQIISPLKPW